MPSANSRQGPLRFRGKGPGFVDALAISSKNVLGDSE
jgi:hypothetical protein